MHMDNSELEKTILDLARPLVEALGLVIWGVEIIDGGRLVARLYIDSPPSSDKYNENLAASASIGQCEEVSRQLDLALEVGGYIQRPYILEVSSPGLERVFFNMEQMRPYIGGLVEARLWEPLDENSSPGRKNWRGKLLDLTKDAFIIQPCSISPDGGIALENSPPLRVPWQKTRRARRLHVFKKPEKPGKKRHTENN